MKLSLPISALLSLVWLSSTAKAEIRLDRDEGTMVHLQIHDQGSSPNCYAHVATQMIDAYRLSHGESDSSRLVSQANVSVLSNFFSTRMILATARNRQVCSSQKMKAFLGKSTDDEFTDHIHLAEEVHQAYESKLDFYRQHYGPPRPEPIDNTAKVINFFLKDRIDANMLAELGADIEQWGFRQDILWADKILPRICRDDLINLTNLPEPEWTGEKDIRKILAEANGFKKLSSTLAGYFSSPKSQPVEIGFCANILKGEPSYTDVNDNSGCYKHAALLIGTHPNTKGGNDFLLRNSWGNSWCPPPAQGLECDGTGGQVWISDSILLKVLDEITAWKKE